MKPSSFLPISLRRRCSSLSGSQPLPGTCSTERAIEQVPLKASLGRETTQVAIIGAGFAGLAVASHLQDAGVSDFVLLERASAIGGTWRDQVYPGCACDVPSHLYSLSSHLNPHWTRRHSGSSELLDYLKAIVASRQLSSHLRLGVTVKQAVWDEAEAQWSLVIDGGTPLRAQFLVMATGSLREPKLPKIAGLESFAGNAFHSARWDHSCELSGRDVAVVGTGASAIQFIPEVAKLARRVTVFQRNAPWVMPRRDKAISALSKRLFERVPGLMQLNRARLYWELELAAIGFVAWPSLMRLAEYRARVHLERSIRDPELRRVLTPNYRLGCKRVLSSNAYYPAMNQPHVRVVTDPIVEITPEGVRTEKETSDCDVLIFGTGFSITRSLTVVDIVGRGGRHLLQTWRTTPGAYLGMHIHHFPNFFLMTGPHTGVGHTSLLFMIEAQSNYVIECLGLVKQKGKSVLEIRQEAQLDFSLEMQKRSRRTVWESGCESWYLDKKGRNVALWP
ncbi:MAG: NAD(P)/FAD-dependent oxidoreductase, partial [Myxococcota bacterium]